MVARKRGRKASSRKAGKRAISSEKFLSRKIKFTLTFLLSTLILFAAAWIGYEYFFLSNDLVGTFFLILAYLSGSLSLAFFIALLIFLILKAFKK